MAKTESKKLERTYNIPLRKEYRKVANWKQTKKAVKATKEFLARHMKSNDIRLGKHLNEKLWQHGIKNPPHHVKVTTIKDDKGVVRAELFGHKIEKKKEEKKKSRLEEVAQKVGLKTDKKPTEKEERKTETKSEEKKEKPAEKTPTKEKTETSKKEQKSVQKEEKVESKEKPESK